MRKNRKAKAEAAAPRRFPRNSLMSALGWAPQGGPAMVLALDEGDEEKALELLAGGLDPNEADEDAFTPLMAAAACGSERVIRALAAAGARLDDQDSSGLSALAIAAERDNEAALAALIELGADAQLDRRDWSSPLGRAMMRGKGRGLELLLALKEREDLARAAGQGAPAEGPGAGEAEAGAAGARCGGPRRM